MILSLEKNQFNSSESQLGYEKIEVLDKYISRIETKEVDNDKSPGTKEIKVYCYEALIRAEDGSVSEVCWDDLMHEVGYGYYVAAGTSDADKKKWVNSSETTNSSHHVEYALMPNSIKKDSN